MEPIYYVFFVGLIIFAAHFFTALFEKTRIPDVLPLIFIGILIGPMFEIIPLDVFGEVGTIFSTVALALMLFEGGSHLSIDTLQKSLKDSLIITISTFILTILSTAIISYYILNFGVGASLFIGATLGSISPAVVVPIVRMLKLSENTKSTLVIETAITDVLSIIFALGIIRGIQGGHGTFMEFIGTTLIASIAMSIVLGFSGAVVWSTILEKIRKFPNTIFTSLAFLFLLYGLSDILGYSGPISVLIFGIVLANSKKIPLGIVNKFGADHLTEFTSIEKTLFSEVLFLVKTFFFIYLGMSIQFSNFRILIISIVITILIYTGRLILCKLLLSKEISTKEAAMISFIIPKGLAAAVLAEVPTHMISKIDNPILYSTFDEIRSVIYMVILLSILLTALLIYTQETGITKSKYNSFFSKFKILD